jgi:hypothetical protein
MSQNNGIICYTKPENLHFTVLKCDICVSDMNSLIGGIWLQVPKRVPSNELVKGVIFKAMLV